MVQQENKSIERKKMLHLKIIVIKVVTLICLKYLQACLNASIEVSKEKYYNAVNKLINTKKNSESILVSIKNFLK